MSRRPWLLLAAACLAAGLLVPAMQALAGLLPAPSGPGGMAALEAALTFLLAAALGGVAWAGIRLTDGVPLTLGPRVPVTAALGGAIGLGVLLAALAYAALAGLTQTGAARPDGVALLLFGTVVVMAQAAGEELFFRGWLQPGLAREWREPAALLATALAFSLLHLAGGARAPVSLLNILLAGLLFGLLRMRSGGLAAPVAAHGVYNAAETLLFGLVPNPGTGSFGSWWNIDLAGSATWGGSGEGLNASVGLSVALVAALLPLAAGWRPLRLAKA